MRTLDLLEGAGAISDYTGIPVTRVFYLCDRGLLPVFKIGTRWCARKSELDRTLSAKAEKVA
jgi:hypothetical protein